MWDYIGLHSERGDTWAQMGRTLIKAILNSAHGLTTDDVSDNAQAKRRLNDLSELDGLVFAARIDVTHDRYQQPQNRVQYVLAADDSNYLAVMQGQSPKQVVAGHVLEGSVTSFETDLPF